MEASIIIPLLVVVVVVLKYLIPLVRHRIKTRKVKVVVVDEFGKRKTDVLYLYPDDPLWRVINTHKGGNHG